MTTSTRRGIMVTEVTTVFAVAAVLVALLLPAIQRARTAARSAQCKNNLRQFALVMHSFAESDELGRLCSGATDYLLEGSPDTYGWVADGVNMAASMPSEMTCPENTAQHVIAIEQLISADEATRHELPEGLVDRLTQGIGQELLSTQKLSAERQDYVETNYIQKGYDTNYTPSWLLVRGHISGLDGQKQAPTDLTTLKSTFRPLMIVDLDQSNVATHNIPFLSDGRGRASADVLLEKSQTSNATGRGRRDSAELAKPQTLFVDSMTSGPVFWDPVSSQVLSVLGENINGEKPGGLMLPKLSFVDDALPGFDTYSLNMDDDQAICEVLGGVDERYWLQDTRRWQAVHDGRVNILMGDGSVKTFVDSNGDSYLNPGFPAALGTPEQNGYAGSEIELPASECYNGPVLAPDDFPEF